MTTAREAVTEVLQGFFDYINKSDILLDAWQGFVTFFRKQ
jgi:hypothetical protein